MLTVNPYLIGAKLIINRLLWDIKNEARQSKKKMKSIANQYSGHKALILCNGPSLNTVDFNSITESGVYSIGLNKINLLFDQTNFRPNCVVSVNRFVLKQNYEFFQSTNIPLFLDSYALNVGISPTSNRYFLHSTSLKGMFAQDCSISILQGHTVTFVALQIAFHLGFENVAIVGCDHYFQAEGTPNKTVISGEKDPDHFSEKYFSGNVPWQLPDLTESEISYMVAKKHFESNNRRIWNCTEGGALEIFPRMPLETFLEMPS